MSEPIKQPQNSNNQPPAPQAQPQELESAVRVGVIAQTRNSNSLVRNIVYVISLMGLVSLLFWLITPPNQTILTAQVVTPTPAGGWEIPVPPNTVTATTTVTPTSETTTLPTETPFIRPTLDTPPTSHITPIATILLPGGGSYGIFDSLIITSATYTPGPPTPTHTPTPIPALRAISDEPLLSPELIATMGILTNSNSRVLAWPSDDVMILETGSSPVTRWQYSMSQQTITPTTYIYPQIDPAIIEEFQQYNPSVARRGDIELSPDGKWVVWNGSNIILLKRIGAGNLPIEVIKLEYLGIDGFGYNPWSLQSDRFVFTMLSSNSFRYEIYIANLSGKIITTVPLGYGHIWEEAWSPDGQYLAFSMVEEPHSGVDNLYVVKSDGTGLSQLTYHGLVDGDIHWSPSGDAIVYIHDEEHDNQPWIVTLVPQGGK